MNLPESVFFCLPPELVTSSLLFVSGELTHFRRPPSSNLQITTMSGMQVDMRLSVHSVPFAAHADYAETSDFIRQLQPKHVVMVHGDLNTMMRMKQKLLVSPTSLSLSRLHPL